MKKIFALMLTLTLVLTFGGCAVSNQQLYERAQLSLGSREYHVAAQLFAQLGEYRDAADYSLYASGLEALQKGDLTLARTTLEGLQGFKSADRYLLYLDAEELARLGDTDQAKAGFDALGSFADSPARAAEMADIRRALDIDRAALLLADGDIGGATTLLTPYADFEEAQVLLTACGEAVQQLAYDAAQELYADSQYEAAMSAFAALGVFRDARVRVQQCRSALYHQAEDGYAQVTMASSEGVLHQYQQLEGYAGVQQRIDALLDTYGTRLALIHTADEAPFVQFALDSKQDTPSTPILWQVAAADVDHATLVCCALLTAEEVPTDADDSLDLTIPERQAEPVLSAPVAWQPSNADTLLTAIQSGSAMQEAFTAPESLSGRWFDSLTETTGGTLLGCLSEEGGLRPVIQVAMETWPLTEGEGTQADPYR